MYGERYEVGQTISYMHDEQEHIGIIEKIYSSGRIIIEGAYHVTWVQDITGIVSDVDGKMSYTQPIKIPTQWETVAHQKHIESIVDSVTEAESNELFTSLENFNNQNWRAYWVDVALLNNDEEMFKKYA